VLGRNGVGKTSLLDALAGQQPISKGSITFDGADITRLKPSDRAGAGVCAAGREIFPLPPSRRFKTGFAPLKARTARSRTTFSLFGAQQHAGGAAATCPAASSSSWRSAVRWSCGRSSCCSTSPRRDPALDHQGYRPRHLLLCAIWGASRSLVEQYSTSRASWATFSS
jgi:energy-coupling factor transporter ATP-binding protein EcfA2